jgi:hypothetical protein
MLDGGIHLVVSFFESSVGHQKALDVVWKFIQEFTQFIVHPFLFLLVVAYHPQIMFSDDTDQLLDLFINGSKSYVWTQIAGRVHDCGKVW